MSDFFNLDNLSESDRMAVLRHFVEHTSDPETLEQVVNVVLTWQVQRGSQLEQLILTADLLENQNLSDTYVQRIIQVLSDIVFGVILENVAAVSPLRRVWANSRWWDALPRKLQARILYLICILDPEDSNEEALTDLYRMVASEI